MIKFKKNGMRHRQTLNGKEVSDILASYSIKQKAGLDVIGAHNFNVEMKTTVNPNQIFIELDIREIEAIPEESE